MASSWLGEFKTPAFPAASSEALAAKGRAILRGVEPTEFVGRLGIVRGPYVCTPLGDRVPSAAALACASGEDVLSLLGVIFYAAKANVAGQRKRLARARKLRCVEKVLAVVRSVLAHIEKTDAFRVSLPWDKVPTWVPADAVDRRSGQLLLNRVTHRPLGPFFFDRAADDLVLFLHCCRSKIALSIVLTPVCTVTSVFRLVKALSASPPTISAVYAVDPKGISLPPPFIGIHWPLGPPTTQRSATAWAGVTGALTAYARGECTAAEVRSVLIAGQEAKETDRCSVASPVWLEWLLTHQYAWTAIATADYDSLPGPVALFTEKSRPP